MPARYCWLVGLVLLAGCSGDTASQSDSAASADGNPLQPVTLQLNWYPEAEHGGFYAALVHGEFEKEGLQVEILKGGPNVPVIQQVATGAVTFGIANADQLLLGRASEADVVALMSPMQDSPRCIMVHKKSGITSFQDLRGITLGITSTNTFALFMQQRGLLENVRIVPYPGNVLQFLRDENFAQQAYSFSEPFIAEKKGGDPHCLMVSDLGFNPYTSVLFTRGETIRQQPELVRKMVAASIRGWQKYLDDPEQTNRHIHEQNPEMDAEILEYGVEVLKPLCINESTPLDQLGRMTVRRWEILAEQLVEAGVIDAGAVDARQAFTTKFLTAKLSASSPE